MRQPVLTIFYQFDPWNTSIGGIQTIIQSFIRYAPSDFSLRLAGMTSQARQAIGQWHSVELEGKEVQFMPLFRLQNDNVRHLIPTTLKYTTALLGRSLASDFMHFHRLEPSLATLRWQGDKTLFIHNDISQQISAAGSKKAILWRRFPALYYALEQQLVRQFTQVLSCNSEAAKLYQDRCPEIADRVTYFRNTVDQARFYPLPPPQRQQQRQDLAARLGLPDSTRFLLFAGRLHPQKDPLLLLRSFRHLLDTASQAEHQPSSQPNLHLLIAGTGELEPEIRADIDRLNLADRVTLLGAVNQTQLADLHRIASVLVLSSAYEGLPLVVLEALACGTPIVTTRSGETPNLLSADSGIVCEARSPESLAAALRQVLECPDRFPVEACLQAAAPFGAREVVSGAYDAMRARWQQRVSAN